MNVALLQRDVEIAADDEELALAMRIGDIALELIL
jgi:hypothetical protein